MTKNVTQEAEHLAEAAMFKYGLTNDRVTELATGVLDSTIEALGIDKDDMGISDILVIMTILQDTEARLQFFLDQRIAQQSL